MAGGKLSPRQKMINLMYLVFIAMLALNMSKEVLSAFGLLEEKITQSNESTDVRNDAFMANLAVKASDEPQTYAELNEKAKQINTLSNTLDNYIEEIKTGMMKTVKPDQQDNYEVQDKPDFLDTKFFKGDKLSKDGLLFESNMLSYRDGIIDILGDDYPVISKSVNEQFGMQEESPRGKKVKVNALKFHFEGFPMIASKTKLTQIQSNIKTIQNEILSSMMRGEQTASLSVNTSNYSTLLETPKSAYYAGETFDGSIVLGRVDDQTKPNRAELTLDGKALVEGKDFSFEGGRVKLNVSAGSPGDHTLEGNLIFKQDGEETEVPVSRSFSTISKPNAAVIAADKMNVVYRGVDNPMTISIPGIPDNKVSGSATGLSKGAKGKYIMRPGKGREVTITASGTLPDGVRINTPAKFRIKDIPRPTGTIRGEDGNGGPVRMNRQGLEISSVGAMLLDFDFDLNLKVTAFSFKVAGQPTVKVSGNKLNAQAKSALKRAKRGETVQIFDIIAKISGNSSYKLPRITPVFVELAN
ncbi:MAG: gliding motility protein GldM [Flavobacteriaceae bacterium]|nr:gliding motility protein GldM [Flavobacteriaceae bacterium]